jgi:phosphate transport system substrate-binding protein
MNRALCIVGILIVTIAGCYRQDEITATKGTVLVYAPESLQPLFQKEAEEFCNIYKEAHVSVMGAPTREAIVHLLNDSVPIIVSDRMLNEEEDQVVKKNNLDLQRLRVAEDALAVLVNSLNAMKMITHETMRDILIHKLSNWKQIPESRLTGSVDLVLTGVNSGSLELVTNYYNISGEISPTKVVPTQSDVVNFVVTHPQAIGLVSLACLKNPAILPAAADELLSPVRALAFSGTDSTGQKAVFRLHQANVHLGKYPLHFPVYLYLNKSKITPGHGFSSFITSGRGQQIILNWGLVPTTQPVRLIQLSEENK